MRFIQKQPPPERYAGWQSEQRRSPDYSDIPSGLKLLIKEQMIQEQKGLCCYCCGRIHYDSSHIEHLVPQNQCKTHNRKKLTDHYNMVASCNGYIEDLSEFEEEFCGHLKDNWYDESLFISPLDADCGEYFMYTASGTIQARDNNPKAEEMIRRLGLNDYALTEARSRVIEAIGFFEEDFEVESARNLLREDERGELPSFYNIIEYMIHSAIQQPGAAAPRPSGA